jgi:hypothetical protein
MYFYFRMYFARLPLFSILSKDALKHSTVPVLAHWYLCWHTRIFRAAGHKEVTLGNYRT